MPWGTFKLSELTLDLQNIRTGKQADQRAALQALIADQGQKLVNLAIDIVQMGRLSPGEPLWVTSHLEDPGKQIVLEGNRRVAALKLMENPRLADGTDVAKAFAQLAKEFASKPIRSFEAQVFPSREDAWPWIERRHMGAASGVGLQHWRSLAKERARTGARGARRSLLVLDYLDDDTDEFGEVGTVIEAKSTTVDRVLNNPAMKEVLGVNIDRSNQSIGFDNGDEIAGRRLLRDLITEMAKPDFKFSRIRDEGDRDSFIREFADRSVRSTAAGDDVTDTTASAASVAKAQRNPRLTDLPRTTLAPKSGSRTFRVEGDRLQRLYKECRSVKLAENENSAALLLRVFIELSSEALLVEKSVPIPPKTAARNVTEWSDHGVYLRDKIFSVLGVIDQTSHDKKLQKVRVALNPSSQADGSITTLHGYFHNLHMTPGAAMVREAWDTWEPYLRLLHAARI